MTERTNRHFKCSFCGKGRRQVQTLVAGSNVYICNECVELCSDVCEEERVRRNPPAEEGGVESYVPTPMEIFDRLEEYVIGQTEAKKFLSVAVYNHYKRAEVNRERKLQVRRGRRKRKSTQSDDFFELEKSNIMMVGPTGSGKTLLAKTLAKILDVPFAIADATSLTEAGYVGEDVESILLYLIKNANDDIARAEKGIVYIDEIDKIAKKSEGASTNRDVSGEGVQQALLKLIEGTEASVSPKGGRKHPHAEALKVDTTDILFICGGAFGGIDDIVKERLDTKQRCGFGSYTKDGEPKEEIDEDKIYNLVEPKDLVSYGLISEFVGRIPVLASLETLSEEAFMKILTEPKGSITQQYQKLFELNDVLLHFDEDALKAIASEAITRGTGARGLRSIFEKVMTDTMFTTPTEKDSIAEIIITKECVVDGALPKIIPRNDPPPSEEDAETTIESA